MSNGEIERYATVRIDNVPPFHKEGITLDLDPRANVFIGPNSTGKSTILRELAFREDSSDRVGPEGQLPRLHAVPHIYLPPVRLEAHPTPSDDKNPWGKGLDEFDQLAPEGAAYGTPLPVGQYDQLELGELEYKRLFVEEERFVECVRSLLGSHILEETIDDCTYTNDYRTSDNRHKVTEWVNWQFLLGYNREWLDGDKVYWAMQMLYEDGRGGRHDYVIEVTTRAYGCVREICPEVLVGEGPHHRVFGIGADDYVPGEVIQMPEVEFGFEMDTPDTELGTPIPVSTLSTGTQGLYLWIWYLACRIGFHYRFYEDADPDEGGNWWERPAILLIDEIENHLHPTWQRRVIPALLKHFPGLQILASTHSPFVVAGLKRGQIHALYREDGAVKVDKLSEEEKEERIEAWPVEDILRQFMEVYDPTDWATSIRSSALRWLRNRELNDEPAKDWLDSQLAHLGGIPVPERTRDEAGALVWLGQRRDEHPPTTNRNAYEWYEKAVEYLESVVDPDWEEGGPYAAGNAELLRRLEKMLEEQDLENRGNDTEG